MGGFEGGGEYFLIPGASIFLSGLGVLVGIWIESNLTENEVERREGSDGAGDERGRLP